MSSLVVAVPVRRLGRAEDGHGQGGGEQERDEQRAQESAHGGTSGYEHWEMVLVTESLPPGPVTTRRTTYEGSVPNVAVGDELVDVPAPSNVHAYFLMIPVEVLVKWTAPLAGMHDGLLVNLAFGAGMGVGFGVGLGVGFGVGLGVGGGVGRGVGRGVERACCGLRVGRGVGLGVAVGAGVAVGVVVAAASDGAADGGWSAARSGPARPWPPGRRRTVPSAPR